MGTKRIYVGNLPYTVTEAEVRALFEPHGTVQKVDILMDRVTARPRGFGFVEMDDIGAMEAIEKLKGANLGGRSLRINEAKERTETPRRRPGGGSEL